MFYTKKHTWISYLSFGLGLLFVIFLFLLPNLPTTKGLLSFTRAFFMLGVPINVILSTVALFKKDERKLLPIIALILSLTFVFLMVMFIFMANNFAP